MDFWMIARQDLKQDLLDIFSALGNLQYQYDWVITDHGLWYGENCPDDVRKRWQWTGLLMDGRELVGVRFTQRKRLLDRFTNSAAESADRLLLRWLQRGQKPLL